MEMLKRSLVLMFAGLLLTGMVLPDSANAQSARQRQMQRNRETKRELEQKVKQLRSEKKELSEVINSLDQRRADRKQELDSITKQLKGAEKTLSQMKVERKQIEDNLASYRDTLGERMRAMYMQGDMGYLDLLFNANNFNDFVDRVFYVQTICNRDENLITQTQEDQARLAEKIQQINLKIDEISAIREAQRLKLAELNQALSEKNQDLAAINADEALYNRQIKEMEAENKRIAAMIRQSNRSASGYKGAPWTSSFLKPCNGPITSGYGYRTHPIFRSRRMHTGVDIGAPYGTTIKAAGDGKVVSCGWFGGYGNCVIIDHGKGRSTLYGHCSRLCCSAGDIVKAGQKIAEVGSTGNSTGNHCHFEVRINGDPVNPMGSF
jgi:murein DD-endopeptidase MepM/ murein hydrolase activator NlpD